jgi:hypothetical protein
MQQANIFTRINTLDSAKQERLFLIQKYKDFRFSTSFLSELNLESRTDKKID